mgnify:CR=1 FL=1
MKRILILIFVLYVCGAAGRAQDLKTLFVALPDSLSPLLTEVNRADFGDFLESGMKAEVKNLLGEASVMDTLAQDFVQIRLSSASTLQMKKLPMEQGDSVLCVVKTFAGPEKESELHLFTQDWKALDASRLFDGKSIGELAGSLVQKPDTMSESRFEELKAMIEPRMVSALLLQHENAVVVRLSLPLLSTEDKKLVNAIKLQRKFNWSGKSFKES